MQLSHNVLSRKTKKVRTNRKRYTEIGVCKFTTNIKKNKFRLERAFKMLVQNLLKILFKTCSDHPVKESSTILSHHVNTNDKNNKLSCVIIGFLIMLNN